MNTATATYSINKITPSFFFVNVTTEASTRRMRISRTITGMKFHEAVSIAKSAVKAERDAFKLINAIAETELLFIDMAAGNYLEAAEAEAQADAEVVRLEAAVVAARKAFDETVGCTRAAYETLIALCAQRDAAHTARYAAMGATAKALNATRNRN